MQEKNSENLGINIPNTRNTINDEHITKIFDDTYDDSKEETLLSTGGQRYRETPSLLAEKSGSRNSSPLEGHHAGRRWSQAHLFFGRIKISPPPNIFNLGFFFFFFY